MSGFTLSKFSKGGILDDADVEIKKARFEMWDYQGEVAEKSPALAVTFLSKQDGQEVEDVQYYSAGKAQFFLPSEDGKSLVPQTDKDMISDSCNAAAFLIALLKLGLPEHKLEKGDISIIEGTKGHVSRVPQPKRKGLRQADDDTKQRTVLVFDKIHKFPWDADKPSTAPVKEAAKVVAGDGKIASRAGEILITMLAAGPVAKSQLAPKLVQMVKGDDPERPELLRMMLSEEFLNKSDIWKLEGGQLSLR